MFSISAFLKKKKIDSNILSILSEGEFIYNDLADFYYIYYEIDEFGYHIVVDYKIIEFNIYKDNKKIQKIKFKHFNDKQTFNEKYEEIMKLFGQHLRYSN